MMMGMLVMHDLLHLQHGSARRDCGTLLIEVQRRIVMIANECGAPGKQSVERHDLPQPFCRVKHGPGRTRFL